MTLQDFYEQVGGDYNSVLTRLIDEEHAIKYVKMFVQDGCFKESLHALDQENWKVAFRNVHSVKGMCATLGFVKLFDASYILCEELRNGKPEVDISKMVDAFKKEYEATLEAIKGLE